MYNQEVSLMGSMKAHIVQDKSVWDKFVDDSPNGTIFHKWDLLRIVEKHSGYKLLPYGVYQDSELISVFPVFYHKDLLLRRVTTAPPQSCIPHLGLVMQKSASEMKLEAREKYLQKIVENLVREINKLSPNHVHIQMMPMHNEIQPFLWQDFREESFFTYFIDLERPLEDIMAGFDKDARRLIQEAGKKSLEIRQYPNVYTFYGIMQKQYAEQGLELPLISPEYMKDLLAAFPDNLRIYSLYNGKNIVSIIIVAIYHGRMTYWMGNPRLESDSSGNEYIIWKSLQRAKAEGCTEFEINGAGEPWLGLIKSRFNPRLEVSYVVSKKCGFGARAEWAYTHFKKRIWM